jgi:hypothetical protein
MLKLCRRGNWCRARPRGYLLFLGLLVFAGQLLLALGLQRAAVGGAAHWKSLFSLSRHPPNTTPRVILSSSVVLETLEASIRVVFAS